MDPNNITTTPCPPNIPLTQREQALIQLAFPIFFMAVIGAIVGITYICGYTCQHFLSKRSKRITRVPKIPIHSSGLILYTGSPYSVNRTPEARIFLTGPAWFRKNGSKKLNKIMKMIFGLESSKANLVPENTKIISIKMDGFKHGLKCHDFEPIGGVAPESYFTYQIYGSSIIQVTRYVVGEKSYVAGFCIYNEFTEPSMEDDREIEGVDINFNVIKKLMASPKYPVTKSPGLEVKENHEVQPLAPEAMKRLRLRAEFTNVRYCRDLQRGIMTDDEFEAVYHQEWDPKLKYVKTWKCNNCSGIVDSGEPPRYSTLSMV